MEKKRCSRCKRSKVLELFGWKNQKTGLRDFYCRVCRRLYGKLHYAANKTAYLKRNVRALERLAAFIDSLKDCPCADCGHKFPPCAMDFDHRDARTKKLALSKFYKGLTSKRLILEEVAKCDLVCAVCHRIRTCERGGHKHKHRPRRLHGEAPHS